MMKIRTGARKSRWPTKGAEAKPALESRGAANRILTGAQLIAEHAPPVWLIDGIQLPAGSMPRNLPLTGRGNRHLRHSTPVCPRGAPDRATSTPVSATSRSSPARTSPTSKLA